MSDSELTRLRARRDAGDFDGYVDGVRELARRRPDDVAIRIEAAYACDRHGAEDEAIGHYDAAWRLGVPDDARRHFLVGYGSTLRNVGRGEEAVAVLGAAIAEFPGYVPLVAFLALALHACGHRDVALATMLDAVLDAADGTDALDGYDRALIEYRDLLLDDAIAQR